MEEVATMTVIAPTSDPYSLRKLRSSTLENWDSLSLNPQITIDFDEEVSILDVVLKPVFSRVVAASKSSGPENYIFRKNILSNSERLKPVQLDSLKNIK